MSSRASTHLTGRSKPRAKMPPSTPAVRNNEIPASAKSEASRDNAAGNAPAERQQLIAVAAYFIAERRGFAPGNELDDWLRAETEVETRTATALQ